ncbi:extracellular solute-binding protein [Streptomyces sp. SCA3-4]|uniref:extracellular solute-binding protein n=1 Tax=Streptomyces sichuanensis TaxID=2871810 RepID=UPI001CE2DD75|nr:extracellular solute-binding protein [Streptomyces sichuanensis]MCA6094451.1 extracellular solute-binding protein [Streptomyces sichuanensis]
MRPTTPVHTGRAFTALALGSAALLVAASLTACGGSGGDPDTVKIAYKRSTDNNVRIMDDHLALIKKQFEREHRGKKLQLVPIQASDGDYAAKIQQMMRSPKTAPDVVREDTFLINSDIKSGYLRPLDDKLARWKAWDHFESTAKASAKAEDGRTYGVPDGTDTRGLWFNTSLLSKAGLPKDWWPHSWKDVLDAARVIKRKLPGVIPLNVYTGKGAGEAAAMQGFEMLLYGTGADPLYDPAAKKWVAGGQGFKDALDFVRTVYAEKLGPEPSEALDPNVTTVVATDWLPRGKLAIALDGSWLAKNWLADGPSPWPEWPHVMGRAAFPTKDGTAPGRVSLSGGWTWAISAKSAKADLAWQVIETLQTLPNATEWTVRDAQIAVRDDVASTTRYRESMPGIEFFTSLVENTHYRPALPVYPQVSNAIQEAMESVTTGDADAAQAARRYDERLRSIAGASGVTTR